MYKLSLNFRYALGWALRGAAIVTLIGAIFASALPLLVKDRAVRDGLTRALSEWSGGAVTMNGPLHASFTSLSVEARDVTFSSTPRLSPISRIHAQSVTAVLRLPPLLLGRVEFKKAAVEQASFVFRRQPAASKFNITGFDTLAEAIAFADLSRFERIELKDCSFFTAEDLRRPYRRRAAEWISIAHSAEAPDFTLQLRDNGFEAFFRGSISRTNRTAFGSVKLKAPSGHPAAEKIIASIAPWEQGNSISLAGDLIWRGARASLDGADIVIGDRSAKGSLALGIRHGRALLEGTLAYDKLEWMPSSQEAGDTSGAAGTLRSVIFPRAENERTADLDMRISAEKVRAGAYEAGPLALALSKRELAVSIDIAELGAFGGTVSGRLDYDSSRPDALTLNATGSRLNSQLLTSAMGWPFTVSGPLMLRLALDIPLKDKPLAQEIKAATGSFGIVFPAGGALEGDLPERLVTAFERLSAPGRAEANSFSFDEATMEGALASSGARLDIGAESSGSHIAGSLHVAFPGNEVGGTLTWTPGEASEDAPGAKASTQSASVVLSGTVAALSVSASGKPALN